MIKGQYFTQAEMNRWLDEIAPRFQHALDEKKNYGFAIASPLTFTSVLWPKRMP